MTSVSGIRAGRAFVLIEAIDATQTVLNRINLKVRRFANDLSHIGRSMFFGTAASFLPTAALLRFTNNYDDSMRRIQARSHGTSQEMMKLRKESRELGKALGFPADQVGELMNKLAQAGYTRKQIAVMTKPVLDFARAAGDNKDTDPELASDLVTTVLRAFELEADQAGRVADLLTVAANASKFSLEDLGISLAYSLRPAKDFNMTLEDTLALVSQMRNLGIDPSTVGSATRNIMLNLSDPAHISAFEKAMKKVTDNTVRFQDALGNLRDPAELLFEIGEAIKDLGTAQQAEVLNRLLGKRAYTPSLSVIRGENPFKDLRSQFSNAQGIAAQTAATINSGQAGGWRKFIAQIYDMSIAIAESLQPAWQSLLQKTTNTLGVVTEWITQNQRWVVGIVAVAGGFMLLGAGILAVALPLHMLISMFSLLLHGLNLVFIPIRLITSVVLSLTQGFLRLATGAIGMVIGGIRSLTMVSFGLVRSLSVVGRIIGTTWSILSGGIGLFIRGLISAVPIIYGVFSSISAGFMILGRTVLTWTAYLSYSLARMLLPVAAGIVATTNTILSIVAGFVHRLAVSMISVFPSMAATITRAAFSITGAMLSITSAVVGPLLNALVLIPVWLGHIAFGLIGLLPFISTFVISLLSMLTVGGSILLLVGVFGSLVAAGKQVFAVITDVFNAFVELGSGLAGWGSRIAQETWGAVLDAGKVFLNGMRQIWRDIQTIFAGVMDALSAGEFTVAMEIATAGLKLLWQQTVDTMLSTWEEFSASIKAPFINAITDIKQFWNTFVAEYKKSMWDLVAIPARIMSAIPGSDWLFQSDSGATPSSTIKRIEARKKQIDAAAVSAANRMEAEREASLNGGFGDPLERIFRQQGMQNELSSRRIELNMKIAVMRMRAARKRQAELDKMNNPASAIPGGAPVFPSKNPADYNKPIPVAIQSERDSLEAEKAKLIRDVLSLPLEKVFPDGNNTFIESAESISKRKRIDEINNRLSAIDSESRIAGALSDLDLLNQDINGDPLGVKKEQEITSVPQQVIEAVQKGTIEAAKKNAELIRRQMEIDRGGNVQEKMLGELEEINAGVAGLELGEGV